MSLDDPNLTSQQSPNLSPEQESETDEFLQWQISSGKFSAYTVKLPSEQLAALQSIWLELKRMYGPHSPDKSGMIQQAVSEWLLKWDGPERQQQLRKLLEIKEETRRRQFKRD